MGAAAILALLATLEQAIPQAVAIAGEVRAAVGSNDQAAIDAQLAAVRTANATAFAQLDAALAKAAAS